MKTSLFPLAVAALLALADSALAQRDFSNVEIKVTHVAGSVYMLEGSGGNIGISAGPDGLLIIDSQFAPLAPRIEAALKDLKKGDPKFLLNTHWHGDHTGGNAHFGRYADIIAHANVRKRLADSGGRPAPKEALPVITFDDKLSVHFNGEEIKVFHVPPGHTDGDSIIFFLESKVLHTGDQFFSGRFPFIDLASGGDVEGYAKNVADILKKLTPDVKIIPGHGPLSTLEDLKTFHAMLEENIGMVKKAISEGKTLDQIKAAGVPEKYKDWGSGFINNSRWLEILYNGLSAKRG